MKFVTLARDAISLQRPIRAVQKLTRIQLWALFLSFKANFTVNLLASCTKNQDMINRQKKLQFSGLKSNGIF